MKRAVLVCLFAAPLCFAVPDTIAKGAIRFKITVGSFQADDYYDFNSEAAPLALGGAPADYTLETGQIQLEYGWAHDLALVFRSEYRNRELDGGGQNFSNSGVAGVYMAIRQRLNLGIGNSRVLAETGVFIPKEDELDKDLPLGSDGVDWILLGSYIQNFFPTAGGFEMDFGYRFRNEAPDNELLFNAKLKFGQPRLIQARLEYDVVESQDDRKIEYDPLTYPLERGYQNLGLTLSKNLTNSLTADIGYADTLKGRNHYDRAGWRVGLTWVY